MLLAAKLLREGTSAPACTFTGRVGENLPRVDAPRQDGGRRGICRRHARRGALLRQRRAQRLSTRAGPLDRRVRGAALPGVVALLTADDLPGNPKVGHLKKDYDVLIPVGGITHFLGDAVAPRRGRGP